MKVAVIGGGPAGITAAYELAKGGAEVEVFEAANAVGGMCRSIELWEQTVDLGPHRFFSNDARVNRLWLEVVGDDYRMVDRLTRIYYKKRFFYYPLQPANALWNMGLYGAARCMLSYFKEKVVPTRRADGPETFESWVVGRFGRRLFEMFFKSYSEKLWGIPCDRLDADFAAQRIKKFSLGEAMKSALGLAKDRHKTLVDRFAYPLGGTGMVYRRMGQHVLRRGGKINLGLPVLRVLHEGRRVTGLHLSDGKQPRFDHVVSTMPLTLLVRGLDGLPDDVAAAAAQLTYRNTIVVYLHVDGTDLFSDQWLYVHSPDLLAGRVTNFRNWVPELYGDTQTSIVAAEYWCNDADALWAESDEPLIDRARRELQSTGLLVGAAVLEGRVMRIHRSYPVYRHGYKEHLARVMEFLGEFTGLTVIGRYGAFRYNNQDHSILMGILAAQGILRDQRVDLATVNTDYETYQESTLITETGLVGSELTA